MRQKVFIAGPYTNGDVALNVRNAFAAANELADHGFAPFVPHYTHFWHLMYPRPYDFWLELSKQFLTCCDCLLRLGGESKGADVEEEHARALGLPVFRSINEVFAHYREAEDETRSSKEVR